MRLAGWMVAIAAVAGCSPSGTPAPPGDVVIIHGYVVTPLHLSVPPGTTIVVRNDDPFLHTFTSAAAPGTYAPGAVNGVQFDTGPFDGIRTITIPADAPVGTVIPCYCAIHGAAPGGDPDITVVAP